jgi:hypothetical protein
MKGFYDDCLTTRLSETCDWVLTKPVYLDWIGPEFPGRTAKSLWINSPAGFGKTVLCASLIQCLAMSSPDPLAFFFFSAAEVRNDFVLPVKTWLSQLVANLPDVFELALDHAPDKDTEVASTSEIWDLLSATVRKTPNCTLVLDGLDECAQTGDKRMQFLAKLKQAVGNSTTRILVVSRDEVDIRSQLEPLENGSGSQLAPITTAELRITEDDVRHDIARFTHCVVDQRLPNKPEALRHDLAALMADKCEGMFLWVNLQKDDLTRGMNRKQLQLAVHEMPSGLEREYERN